MPSHPPISLSKKGENPKKTNARKQAPTTPTASSHKSPQKQHPLPYSTHNVHYAPTTIVDCQPSPTIS